MTFTVVGAGTYCGRGWNQMPRYHRHYLDPLSYIAVEAEFYCSAACFHSAPSRGDYVDFPEDGGLWDHVVPLEVPCCSTCGKLWDSPPQDEEGVPN